MLSQYFDLLVSKLWDLMNRRRMCLKRNAFYCVVVVLGFYVPPTAKVIRRRDLVLKSHPKDWRSPGSNSRPLVYKAGSLTARPQRLLFYCVICRLLYKSV